MHPYFYYIAMSFLHKIGPIHAKNLISYCGGVESVFQQKKGHLLKIPGIGEKLADLICTGAVFKQTEAELEFIEKYKINVLPYTSDKYPKRLLHCTDSPILLYSKGDSDLNPKKSLAIVGTRKCTKYGRDFVAKLIEELSDFDIQIVSGMALGIDAQAHKSAVAFNKTTIGVLGHALNTIYPFEHKSLAISMIEKGGSLLSEYPSQNKMHPSNFPQRNRIIAGMSDAIIVVESAIKGGAVITANIANSYNRDVFALPGRYRDNVSKGCNFLLKTFKAQVIEGAEDLLKQMSWDERAIKPKKIQRELALDLNPQESKIIEALKDSDGLETDLLAVKTNLSGSKLASHLLELELKGIIYSLPGNRFVLN